MKTRFILLLLLIFTVSSFATTTTITSLPYTFDANMMSTTDTDTLVLGASKLSSTTSGITLASLWKNELHDVVLNLGTDTLEFGTGGGNSNVGVRISGTSSYQSYNLKIVGGYILHNPSDTTADLNRCLSIGGNNILVKDVNATVRGYNGKVFIGNGAYIYNDTISGGTFRSEVSGFTSRCQYDASVVELISLYKSTLDANNAETHWVVDGLTINGGPHVGIFVSGYDRSAGEYATCKIMNCNIMTDARNEFYLVDAGLCNSTSNPYGISFRTVAGGLIYNNTIISGTTYGGNRGILIERSDSSLVTNPLIIRKNTVNVHEGPNVHYGDALPLHALRIRYGPGNILVDSNTFIGTGDSDSGTIHTGTQVHIVRFTNGTGGVTNVTLKHNTIRAIALDPSVSDCQAVLFDGVTADSVFFFENNNITSSGNIYKFGDFNGESLGQLIKGDTVGFESIKLSSAATYHVGDLGNNWDCGGNIARDITYTNGTSDTDIKFASNGTLDITIQKTLDVNVMGNNNQVVTGATVTIVNGYGKTVMSGITNSSGRYSGSVSYWFESRTQTDSTNYNNFSLTVQKGADTYVSDFVVDKDVILPVVNLLNTAGEIDSIPPDPIIDLGCSPGTGNGNINLSWTSTGDDGSTGSGILYEIKYSTSVINASNFDGIATTALNAPSPLIAGTTQSMTISGLTPGINYYLAMKIYDDGGNSSLLSNVVSCEASVDITTGGDGSDQFVSTLLSPLSGSTIQTVQPTLSTQNITAVGTNDYFFEVATDASFTSITTTSPAIPESNSNITDWQVDTQLETDLTYYWRVKVNNNPYSLVSNFTITQASLAASIDIFAYPNPIDFSNGEQLNFTFPPDNSVELTIQTISGATVLHKVGVLGSWKWDGHNATGSRVATGTYLWYLQMNGQTYSGKIVNKFIQNR